MILFPSFWGYFCLESDYIPLKIPLKNSDFIIPEWTLMNNTKRKRPDFSGLFG
jgi:hypothetical protein